MGIQQSKEEQLYQELVNGNINGIRSLRSQGAGLEYIDKEGRTPLMLACLRPNLLNAARVLIELGANVNAYRPGANAGTPLHHAAKSGLEQTVVLLLSSGANPFVLNDDCRSALDLARERGHTNVVRTIESRICFFCGWLRECSSSNFIEALFSQFTMTQVWTVVVLREAYNPPRPLRLELAIYPNLQVGAPRSIVPLWKCDIAEPRFNLSDPSVEITEKGSRIRYKFQSASEGDKPQLRWFYDACRGVLQLSNAATMAPAPTPNAPPVAAPPLPAPGNPPPGNATGTSEQEEIELAMAISESMRTALAEGVLEVPSVPESSNAGGDPGSSFCGSTNKSDAPVQEHPPAGHYPLVDSAPVNLAIPATGDASGSGSGDAPKSEASGSGSGDAPKSEENGSISGMCVICLDAPVEGACTPCGHMAGCMRCLKEIEAKHWGCPVCRAKIDQVIRLYAV